MTFKANASVGVITKDSLQNIASKQIEITKLLYLLSPERMFSEFNGEFILTLVFKVQIIHSC